MLPRQVLPRQFYLIARRCTQRDFLLRPDAATNNAFLYCLIAAALRCEIEVLLPCAMSNHYHAVIYDRMGRYPEFLEHFHKLVARSQNALRGRWENFWASEQTCVVKLVGRDAVVDKLVYAATNPVLDDLVDRVHHWPGVSGLAALLNGRPLRVTRPLHFFRRDGSMPEELEMAVTIPAELGPTADVLAELRDRVRAVEDERATERQRTGRRVLGRRAVLAQSWRERPTTSEPRRNLRPQVASRGRSAFQALAAQTPSSPRAARAANLCGMNWRRGVQCARSTNHRHPRSESRCATSPTTKLRLRASSTTARCPPTTHRRAAACPHRAHAQELLVCGGRLGR